MVKLQGEDLSFSIELFEKDGENPINIDSLADLTAAVFTDGCQVIRFSKTNREEYKQLTRESEYKYTGRIDSGETKKLAPGAINLEVSVKYAATDGTQNGSWVVKGQSVLGQLKVSQTKND